MNKRIRCPRCDDLHFHRTKFKHGCLLCDDRGLISPALAAAYRLLCINGLPGRLSIERMRKDLGE